MSPGWEGRKQMSRQAVAGLSSAMCQGEPMRLVQQPGALSVVGIVALGAHRGKEQPEHEKTG